MKSQIKYCECGCGQKTNVVLGKARRFVHNHHVKGNHYLLGRKRSKESIAKGIISNTGQKRTEETKRKISESNKGRRHTEEHKKKNSAANTGKHKDYKNPNWRGGITPDNRRARNSIEFRLWRESVFARDNWTCQKTGIKGGKLHPHHIKNFAQYPELRFAIDNGITLSEKAHMQFHHKYGSKNNTKEQIDEFLQNFN